ncbi:MAG: hypothetical protein RLZZ301_1052 [Bacteroidota bacterium]|jgi:hypothetical protein
MKKNAAFAYFASIAAVHVGFLLLAWMHVFPLSFQEVGVAQLSAGCILAFSMLILFARNRGNHEELTFRFLILSVSQLLAYLSTCLAFIYTDQRTDLVLYMLGLSLTVLIVQTSFLVRQLK